MGQASRKFELVEVDASGFPIAAEERIGKLIGKPLGNPDLWISAEQLKDLSGISIQMSRKAIRSRIWRGADLVVRQVEIGRGGAGGKALQVHVDSLPGDLRAAWYLERGIVLHEKPDTETSQRVLEPEHAHQTDARFETDLALARWRQEVIRPALAFEKGSPERAAVIEDLTREPRLFPNGTRKTVSKQTV